MPQDQILGNTIAKILKTEEELRYSRETVTILAAQNLSAGAVLGQVTIGTVPTTGTADAGNTGNGTCTSVTGGKNVQVGVYSITCIQAVTNGGVFEVTDPNGKHLGTVAINPGAGGTGAFTSDEINLTLTDAGTDFVYGDLFTVTVPIGGLQYRAINFSGVDGSAIAAGILVDAVDASASGDKTLAYTSGGTYEAMPGDWLRDPVSGAKGRIYSITLSSGTWAGGDAAGTFYLTDVTGTFAAGNMNIGTEVADTQTNVCTVGGDASAIAATDKSGVAITRDAQILTDYLVWPAGTSAANKAIGITALADRGIIARSYA